MPIAIDVALLLPEPASALAVELNRQLDGGAPEGLTLDATHLPHITLVQLFAARERLEDVCRRVAEAVAGFGPIDLRVKGLDERSDTVMLVFEDVSALARLHEALMQAVREFEVGGDAGAFWAGAGERPARERDVAWVATYRADHAGDNYLPHVTVGHGRGAGPVAPFTARVDRLAVCHLGRHCTCRVILHELRL
ncbi:MAG: hypothetical protein H6Q10_1158 [Acidobacteria bacterium]|nr:hypothetical protein [Acidobacteriota bacterium]